MNNYTKVTQYEMEVITAIHSVYEDEIHQHLSDLNIEITQEEIANIVNELYNEYMQNTTKHSLLDLINKKTIALEDLG